MCESTHPPCGDRSIRRFHQTTNSGHPSCSEHSSPRARPRYEDAADHVLRPDNSSELDFGGEDGSSRERWSVCLGSMKQQDELMVKRWNDDIDTLLVFVGVESDIITRLCNNRTVIGWFILGNSHSLHY